MNASLLFKILLASTVGLFACKSSSDGGGAAGEAKAASPPEAREAPKPVELLNVSYDPTREFWREVNEKFASLEILESCPASLQRVGAAGLVSYTADK